MLEPFDDDLGLDVKFTLPKLRFKAHEGTAYHSCPGDIPESNHVDIL
jgi:hypothetical protein